MAEADKIKGVDTKAAEATIENVIAQTDNEKAKNGLIYAQKRMAEIQGDLNNANIEEIGYNIRRPRVGSKQSGNNSSTTRTTSQNDGSTTRKYTITNSIKRCTSS